MTEAYRRQAYQASSRQQVAGTRGYEQGYAEDDYQDQRQQRPAKSKGRKGGTWKVVLQFVIGLLVIAGVAAAIVALYVRYYQ
jgi:hypothetical protein